MCDIGCSKRTGCDKDVKFYRIPMIQTSRPDPREVELSIKRRQGYIAAISRPELSTTELEEARICSRHFIFGKPASLFEECHPDWVPNLFLGHSTLDVSTILSITERYERRKARDYVRDAADSSEESGMLPDMNTDVASSPGPGDKANTDGDLDMDTGVTVLDAEVQTDHDEVSLLGSSLNDALQQIRQLKEKVDRLTPFTELAMKDKPNEFIQHYTGLPNFSVLKTTCIYNFTAPSQHHGKLAPFQEYTYV